MLGVPQEERQKLFDWTHQIELSVGDPTSTASRPLGQIGLYLAEKVAEQAREPRRPDDDLTTALIQAEVDGEQLNDFEIAAMFGLLMFAGNDTTRNTISGGTLALIENPDQRQKLIDDPSLIDDAVEEMIRWVTPVMWFKRTPTKDTEIRGVPIKEGDRSWSVYASGSRDEELVADPMRFDVTRDKIKHSGLRRRRPALLPRLTAGPAGAQAGRSRRSSGACPTWSCRPRRAHPLELGQRLHLAPGEVHAHTAREVLIVGAPELSTENRLAATRRRDRPRVHGGNSDTEQAIFAATEELLEQVPLQDLSVAQIIERAGVSRATFYFYFSSKYAVVTGLLAQRDGRDLRGDAAVHSSRRR